MRIAVLSDIHGNLPAFEAALRHVARQKVDQIIIAGDMVIGAPDSLACWQLALSLGCPILRGNHERYVFLYGTPDASPAWSTERFAPLHWAFAQLSAQDRQSMAQLPIHFRSPEAPDLFVVHASERSDYDTVEAYTPEEKLLEMFPTVQDRYIIRGHNHLGQVRLWQKGFIITNGSVGLALDGNPTAQYLLLERNKEGWRIQHQSVPYDVEAVIQRFHQSGYLAAAGPMGRLFFREVITGSHHLVPFLRYYEQWTKHEKLPLVQAVDRFLNDY